MFSLAAYTRARCGPVGGCPVPESSARFDDHDDAGVKTQSISILLMDAAGTLDLSLLNVIPLVHTLQLL